MMMKKNEKLEVRDVAVDAIESTELVEAPEKKQPKKIWLLLAALGPGIVTAMAGNDAGGISTYSTVGAKFGFATLWVIPIMCVLLIVVEMTAARMGAVTGKGFAALIRERFGIRLTALAMLALLIGNVATPWPPWPCGFWWWAAATSAWRRCSSSCRWCSSPTSWRRSWPNRTGKRL